MKKTITESEFVVDMTREGFGFTRKGAEALFNYLEEIERDCDCKIEYDPIAFRCEYTEYENLEEFKENYTYDDIENIEDIQYYTTVIYIDGESFIIQDF